MAARSCHFKSDGMIAEFDVLVANRVGLSMRGAAQAVFVPRRWRVLKRVAAEWIHCDAL